jgi:hypothetical protein
MLPEKGNAFIGPLKRRGFEEERVTTTRLDDLDKSRSLDSDKNLRGKARHGMHDRVDSKIAGILQVEIRQQESRVRMLMIV